jgi:hypothetical protein
MQGMGRFGHGAGWTGLLTVYKGLNRFNPHFLPIFLSLTCERRERSSASSFIFSDEVAHSGVVAGGGATASEFQTPPFQKKPTFSNILFLPRLKSEAIFHRKVTEKSRSNFEFRKYFLERNKDWFGFKTNRKDFFASFTHIFENDYSWGKERNTAEANFEKWNSYLLWINYDLEMLRTVVVVVRPSPFLVSAAILRYYARVASLSFFSGSIQLRSLFFSDLHAPLWSVLEFVTLRDEFALWIAELVRFLLDDDDASESLCKFCGTFVIFNRILLKFVEFGICFDEMLAEMNLLWLNWWKLIWNWEDLEDFVVILVRLGLKMKMNLHLVLEGFYGFDLNEREREKKKLLVLSCNVMNGSVEFLTADWAL